MKVTFDEDGLCLECENLLEQTFVEDRLGLSEEGKATVLLRQSPSDKDTTPIEKAARAISNGGCLPSYMTFHLWVPAERKEDSSDE
jgi:hypothetical protein